MAGIDRLDSLYFCNKSGIVSPIDKIAVGTEKRKWIKIIVTTDIQEENGKQAQGIKVIAKAFQILDLFSIEEPRLTLNQICEKLGQKKTTVFRILCELSDVGIMGKDPLTKQYYLGLLTLKYSALVLHHLELRRRGCKIYRTIGKGI